MKKKSILFYGILFWLPSKIAATALTVISLVAASGAAVDAVDVETSINRLPVRVAVVAAADPAHTDAKRAEVPDPEPPTTDGPWSEMISVSPAETVG